jgi:large subunit ribosomal protein L6
MSRIGYLPITIPQGVKIDLLEDNLIKVKGPKGELFQSVDPSIDVVIEDGEVKFNRTSEEKEIKSKHGLYRSLVNNMVTGVTEGYTATLELIGVGYRASNTGQLLELSLGYSHPIYFYITEEVKLETKSEKGQPPTIILTSNDKQLLGQIAAKIKAFRKPEPYKGKGIRFKGENVRRKAGKAGGK